MNKYEEIMDFASKLQLCGHSALAFTIRKFGSGFLDQQEKIEQQTDRIAELEKKIETIRNDRDLLSQDWVKVAMALGKATKEIEELKNDLKARTLQRDNAVKLLKKSSEISNPKAGFRGMTFEKSLEMFDPTYKKVS